MHHNTEKDDQLPRCSFRCTAVFPRYGRLCSWPKRKFSLRQCASFSPLERVATIHCWTALDVGIDVEQLFDCLIIQNRETVQSIGKSMGWTIGGQHGRRSVLLRHTHRPQRRPYPICVSRRGGVLCRCGGG